MTRLEAPNHTQIPNVILDNLPAFSDGELRLVLAVARKTFGWHKERDELSFSQLMGLTGMRRPMVNRAIKSLLARNILERTPSGKQGFAYRLCIVEITSSLSELVPPGNQFAEGTGTSFLSEPELVSSGNPQKKDKEKKEKNSAAPPARARSHKQADATHPVSDSAVPEDHALPRRAAPKLGPIATALVDVCRIDTLVATKALIIRVHKTAKILSEAGYTPEQIAHFGRWWPRFWRGANGAAPQPEDVQKHWGDAMSTYRAPTPAPAPAPEPEQRRATRADWERAAREVEREGREVPAFLKRYLADGAAAQTA